MYESSVKFRIMLSVWVLGGALVVSGIWMVSQLWSSSAAESTPSPAPPARVLVFGDSWTYGSSASSPEKGYAAVLGDILDAQVTVDGVRGSGYLRPGVDGPSYGERITSLDAAVDPDLVIVQGSINDRFEPEAGYREAVISAWDALAALYPKAQIVVFGPAPHELPVFSGTVRIDHDLAELAEERGWLYVSPLSEKWITAEIYPALIDPETLHPTDSGHRFLAEKLLEALREGGWSASESADSAEQ